MEKKLKWGEAKKQVLSLWPEIKTELEKGATVRSLFKALTEAGRIEMSERPFYRAIIGLRADSPEKAKETASAKAAPRMPVSLFDKRRFDPHRKTTLTPQEALQPLHPKKDDEECSS